MPLVCISRGAARIVTRHLLDRQQRIEIRQSAAAVLDRRGHAEQSLRASFLSRAAYCSSDSGLNAPSASSRLAKSATMALIAS